MIYYAAQIADKMTDALARGDQASFLERTTMISLVSIHQF